MRTTPALRTTPAALGTLAAALLTAGALSLAGASPASAAGPPAHNHDVIWGTIVSPGDLKVRDAPSTGARIVDRLSSGSQDRVECQTRGTSVFGNPHWYWLGGAQGWASAAYIDVGGRHVPSCAVPPQDPCPQAKPCCDPCPAGCNRYH
ncbi:SH3 domain-containing protein [Streptomyces sp. MZ04]|uniref:SH3 domain-containing protein n=1 Tax=Streptomyces sp. MZ04 TaxID=2559236 RepID=UPI00107E84E1|nr:SH3 domain-containing protein [Streptomyces sp. MZ04]TGB03044.1 SH3 domain-containing protein [Streptomyces sp. MZ04]